MLKNIPFYASLLGRELPNGKVSTNSHVLVYGAIEAHSFGPKGCVASNKTIAEETGLKTGSVAAIISVLNRADWISTIINNNNQRLKIEPLMVINPPLIGIKPPLESGLNIDNSIIRKQDTETKVSDAPKEKESNSVNKLFYMVLKKYDLPAINHNNVRKWAADLGRMDDGPAYLQLLLDRDLRIEEGEFRPTLNTAFDVLNKKLKVQRFYNGGENIPVDPRAYGAMK